MGELKTPAVLSEWSNIEPLHQSYESKPYPLEALPAIVRAAVIETQGYIQAPVPMVAACALTNVSIACQGYVDVARDDALHGPTSLYFLTVGNSGERKTACDTAFSGGIESYQAMIEERMTPEVQQYRADKKTHDSKCSGLLNAIKKLSEKGEPTQEKEEAHRQLVKAEPVRPKIPAMLLSDTTPEALAHSLAFDWPAASIVSDEGGSVFGGHGMNRDAVMRNLARLNELWGGKTQRVNRQTSESFTAHNPRLSIHIQIQQSTLDAFMKPNGNLARGSGFLARFLVSVPESTLGYRPYKEPPANTPALGRFNDRLYSILDARTPLNECGYLEPSLMQLSPDAKAAWVEFHDAVEGQVRAGGEFEDVKDVASKIAENAARMAALFTYFDNGTPSEPVSVEHMNSAIAVTAWHLFESQRFFAELCVTDEQRQAQTLNDWLTAYCAEKGVDSLTRRDIQQRGPGQLRNTEKRDRALQALQATGRVLLKKQGQSQIVRVNPALIAGGGL